MKKRIMKLAGMIVVMIVLFVNSMVVFAEPITEDCVGKHTKELTITDDIIVKYQKVNNKELEGTVIEQSFSEDGRTVLVVGSMRQDITRVKFDYVSILVLIIAVVVVATMAGVIVKVEKSEGENLTGKRT